MNRSRRWSTCQTIRTRRQGAFAQILLSARRSLAEPRSEVALAIAALHPDISFHFHDFQDEVRYSVLMERLVAIFCGRAAIAALLAVVGVYGLVAYPPR